MASVQTPAKRPAPFEEDRDSQKRQRRDPQQGEETNGESKPSRPMRSPTRERSGREEKARPPRRDRSPRKERSPRRDRDRGQGDRNRERDRRDNRSERNGARDGGRDREREGDRGGHGRDRRDDRQEDRNRGRDRFADRTEDKGRNRGPPTGPSKPTMGHQPTGPPPGPRNPTKHPSNAPAQPIAKAPTTNGIKQENMDVDAPELNSEDEMARIMGFKSFRSTHDTKVPGNDKLFGVRKEKKTEYRQYMNRVGGFNRPLSPSRET